MNYLAEYERWLHSPVLSEEEKESIRRIDSEEEKKLAFGQTLEFGTAGLRSSMAMGPGRMNIYTVAQATQGMANLIKRAGGEERGAVVGYDSRHNSPLFAKVAAEVLAANGIKT
jgi:phosphoglucomutase